MVTDYISRPTNKLFTITVGVLCEPTTNNYINLSFLIQASFWGICWCFWNLELIFFRICPNAVTIHWHLVVTEDVMCNTNFSTPLFGLSWNFTWRITMHIQLCHNKGTFNILFTWWTESLKKSDKIKDSVRRVKSMLKDFFQKKSPYYETIVCALSFFMSNFSLI